jgi:hypothetical protein
MTLMELVLCGATLAISHPWIDWTIKSNESHGGFHPCKAEICELSIHAEDVSLCYVMHAALVHRQHIHFGSMLPMPGFSSLRACSNDGQAAQAKEWFHRLRS